MLEVTFAIVIGWCLVASTLNAQEMKKRIDKLEGRVNEMEQNRIRGIQVFGSNDLTRGKR